jgi:hypothetical protein
MYGEAAMAYFAARPELEAVFNDAMTEATTRALPGIVAAYDWSRFTRLVDVGGGNGTLMAAVLGSAPALKGTVFDVAAGLAETPGHLERAGLADRCDVVAGDFYRAVPEGGDGYVIKSVLHDWDDERCTTILRNCRKAGSWSSSPCCPNVSSTLARWPARSSAISTCCCSPVAASAPRRRSASCSPGPASR